jgi:hypothetical protein
MAKRKRGIRRKRYARTTTTHTIRRRHGRRIRTSPILAETSRKRLVKNKIVLASAADKAKGSDQVTSSKTRVPGTLPNCKQERERVRRAYFGYKNRMPPGKGAKPDNRKRQRFTKKRCN